MSASQVKELRERTGLGLLECKKALAAAGGDIEAAIEELRKSSGMKAAKKAGRTAADGIVAAKIAEDGSYGIVVEVNSETDFVARDDNFLSFVATVADKAFELRTDDVAEVAGGAIEEARQALVQKNWRKHQCPPCRCCVRDLWCCWWVCSWQQAYRCAR